MPPGCVVTTAAFERFLAAIDPGGSIRREIEQLAADDLAGCTHVGAEARARLESSTLPEDLQEKIVTHYDELHVGANNLGNGEPVAIRSSATSEDSADASFAGLQDTYLWVRGVDSVIDHVRKCWASLYAVESVIYRRAVEIAGAGIGNGSGDSAHDRLAMLWRHVYAQPEHRRPFRSRGGSELGDWARRSSAGKSRRTSTWSEK